MSRPRSKFYPTILNAMFGSVLLSSMIWIVLTEPRLSDGFWPRDIGGVVVHAFGGTVVSKPGGDPQITLSLFSVLMRLTAVLMFAGTVSAIRIRKRSGKHSLRRSNPQFRSPFASAINAVSRPWWLITGVWIAAWLLATSTSNPAFMNFLMFTTPLFAALTAALSLNGICEVMTVDAPGTSANQSSVGGTNHGRKDFLIVLLAAICWEATSFWMNERLYAGLLVPHGDSAMYEEHLWNVWHGKGFRSYLDQGLFLGEHIQVIHLFLLPLHRIWPSYLTMELVASCSLAICVVPIFSMTKRHSGSSRAAMWLALAWLLFFPMHYLDIAIDLKTLRPSCYGLPFLFWGIDFAERRRLIWSSVCFLIALTTQEDFALVVGSIGAVLFLIGRPDSKTAASEDSRRFAQWSIGLLIFSIAWVLLAVLVIIPAFRGGEAVHYSRYFGDMGSSPGDLFRTALHSPGKVLSQLFGLRTLYYVLVLTVPLGLSPLRRPIYLIAGAATFCMLSLIQLGNSSGTTDATGLSELPPVPFHHFHAPLLPVLFWAAAVGIGASSGSPWRAGRRHSSGTVAASRLPKRNAVNPARLAFFCAAFTGISGSLMPVGTTFWSKVSPFGWENLYVPGDRATEFPKVLALLPENARIASTDYVHTRLTHFDRSYDYSGYLRAVNHYKIGVPDDTEYIVIDTGHRYSEIKSIDQVRELKEEPEQWEAVPNDSNGLFIVLKRRPVIRR